jgi:gamma-glutamylputrescine oxidase
MPESPRFEAISPYLGCPEDLQAPLHDDLDADVVVVGAGYAGLTTALALRAQGVDVALLESDFAGSGASGRNAGHLTPTIGKDTPSLLTLFGKERAGALVRFADAAVEHTEELIRKRGIDCDYAATGNIAAAVHPKQEKRLRKAAEAAKSLGAEVQFLSGAELRERGVPSAFLSGILEARGGTFHPGKYVLALRRAALDAGVRLFEQSPVSELVDGRRVRVRTEAGSVTADNAVLATNAYTFTTGRLKRRVAPLRVSLFETRPLSDEQLAELDWRGREGIYTAHEVLASYRLSSQGTIIGGSGTVSIARGDELPPAHDTRAFGIIERAFRDRFPGLRDHPIATLWGGWIGLTLDFLPTVGVEGTHGNIIYGVGFAGHGVAQATLMGDILAERAHGRQHPEEAALQRRILRWPPEPLRFIGGKLLLAGLEAVDRRTDRQVRKQRPAHPE